ncbi:MAG: hypothetical protein C5B55_08610 [Blastocatellia bacterium]|nr:MAG: hypothetical protein C5B55_08610 [Blastocatellia bacterium]
MEADHTNSGGYERDVRISTCGLEWTSPVKQGPQSGSASSSGLKSLSEYKAPVFVVGSARSGTTLLYHTLLSSGAFAVYLTGPVVFDLLVPRFGDLSKLKNRSRLLPVWFQSYQYRLSGLDRNSIENKILTECHSNGDFLRIVMNEIALHQGVERWAVSDPDNLLHIPAIACDIRNALFLHMIRDGRDVALSMNREGWIRPFPWDRKRSLLVAALHWKWKVERGRRFGRQIMHRYLEIHFEDLVSRPTSTLGDIGRFIGHDLDYEQIQRASIGTLRKPNSTFRGADGTLTSSPVGRWKTHLTKSDIVQIESVIGPLLEDLGYPLEFPAAHTRDVSVKLMKTLYPPFFDFKEWLKAKTPLGRLVSTKRLRFNDEVPK